MTEPLSKEEIDALLDIVDEDEEIYESCDYKYFLETNLIKEIIKNSGAVFYNLKTEETGEFLIEIDGQIKKKNIQELFFVCKEYLATKGYWCVSSNRGGYGLAELKWVMSNGRDNEECKSYYVKAESEIKAVLKLTLIFINDSVEIIFS